MSHKAKQRFVDLSTLPAPLASFYHGLKTLAVSAFEQFNPGEASLKCGFIADYQFNAEVTKDNNDYVVSIDLSVPTILHFAFNNLLRDDQLAKQWGYAGKEIPYGEFPQGIPLQLPGDMAFPELVEQILGVSRPKDDSRAMLASSFTDLASSFAIYHEVAHAVLGHVAAMAGTTRFGALPLIELSGQQTQVISQTQRHIWEYEADCVAAMMLVADIVSGQNQHFVHSITGQQDALEEAVSFVLMAVLVLFLLQNQRISAQPTATHPAPEVRFCAVASAVFSHLCSHYGETLFSEPALEATIDHVLATTSQAWQRLCPGSTPIIDYRSPELVLAKVDEIEASRKLQCGAYARQAIFYPFLGGT